MSSKSAPLTPSSSQPHHHQQQKMPSLKVGEGSFQLRRNATSASSNSTSATTISESPLRISLKRLLASKPYFIFSIAILILTLILFLWLLISMFQPVFAYLFICLDFIVCVSFALDVLMRIYIETPQLYFDCFAAPLNQPRSDPTHKMKIMWNWFDFAVVWLSTLSFCLYIVSTHGSFEERIDATVEVILICFRGITSVLRLWGVAKTAGMNYKRTSRNNYMTLDDDIVDEEDFTMSEVVEQGGAQPLNAENDDSNGSELSEDDLFSRPTLGGASSQSDAEKTNKQTSPPKSKPSMMQSTFASVTGKLGSTFGLNDSDEDDSDDDDSGLGEDDLFSRPTMETSKQSESPKNATTTNSPPSQPLAQSIMTTGGSDEDEMFQSCIQDPSLDQSIEMNKSKKD